MLILIRGAGDIASGIAIRLHRSGMRVVMTDVARPTAIRRTVSFSGAIKSGRQTVEDVTARLAATPEEALEITRGGDIAVLVDENCACLPAIAPDAMVDAILAKRNLGTRRDMAPAVIGVGPGFTAGEDCHAVVETMRGHTLGRVYYSGSAMPNTAVPGLIGGYAGERVLRAPADGVFRQRLEIGALVEAGDVAGTVGEEPMRCTISGVLRGILEDGTPVFKGMKAGDVDPRGDVENCWSVSDKALAVGGGTLEAILRLKLTKLAKCAGCGAKVGAGVLAQLLEGIKVRTDPNLLVGFDRSDDASVYKVTDDLAIVQTVDFFPPIADDPYTFGQIAATNALSDVYAMGGEPKLALNLMCVPEKMPREAVHALLRGGYDKVYEAGAIITGGHSILDDEPKYGLAVTGFVHPDKVLTNSGAKPGDVLILTKPIGIGVLTTAAKAELCSEETMRYAVQLMTTLNKAARDAMVKYRVHACTDVTGFGLLGHSCEMAEGSGVAIEYEVAKFKFIEEAAQLAKEGLLPEGMYRNRAFAECRVDPGEAELWQQDMLYDPQTSGGLLIAVAPEDADALMSELEGSVPAAQRVGRAVEYDGGALIRLR